METSAYTRPDFRVWYPTLATFRQDRSAYSVAVDRMNALSRIAGDICELIAEHLPNHGITEINLLPALLLSEGRDIDGHFHLFTNTDKKLYFKSSEGSIDPILDGIFLRTNLEGQMFGRCSSSFFLRHLARHQLRPFYGCPLDNTQGSAAEFAIQRSTG